MEQIIGGTVYGVTDVHEQEYECGVCRKLTHLFSYPIHRPSRTYTLCAEHNNPAGRKEAIRLHRNWVRKIRAMK